MMIAGPLIVIDVETWSRGIPSKRTSMSARLEIATPVFPTSPSERGWSESYPIRVGKSKAVDRPVCPCSRRKDRKSTRLNSSHLVISYAVFCLKKKKIKKKNNNVKKKQQ